MKIPLVPDQASDVAPQIDLLFWTLVAISGVLLAMVFIPMFWWIFRYRHGNDVDRTPLKIATWKIEVAWTAVTCVIFVGIYVWGTVLYFHMRIPPEDAMEINVVGKQWMWQIQHPEGRREINALHVPAGRTVKLILASQDVIHDFYMPAFRVKQDVVPGRYVTEWFRATKTGVYHLFCSEYCGTGHSKMVGEIDVLTPAEYESWLNSGGIAQESMVTAGARLFTQLGCSGCHGENSKIRAPSLVGLYGKPVPLETGEIVTADDMYIHDSILQPQKQIVASYAPVMPTYQGQISESEVFQLVNYIKSLRDQVPPEFLRESRAREGRMQAEPPAPNGSSPALSTPAPSSSVQPAAPSPAPTPSL